MNKHLTEVTTTDQKKRGTRMFYCSLNDVYYGSYASGDVRRIYQGKKCPQMMYRITPKFYMYHEVSNADGSTSVQKTSNGYIKLPQEAARLDLINKRSLTYKSRRS